VQIRIHMLRNDPRITRRLLPTVIGCLTVGIALFSTFAVPRRAQAENDERGKDVFERRCSGCHALDKDKEGPRLRGVYGRVSGSVAAFHYSDALKAAHITWSDATLEKWLADPEKLVPNNDMAFLLPQAEERQAVIAYLKGLPAN
jgi:cytochrome c2